MSSGGGRLPHTTFRGGGNYCEKLVCGYLTQPLGVEVTMSSAGGRLPHTTFRGVEVTMASSWLAFITLHLKVLINIAR